MFKKYLALLTKYWIKYNAQKSHKVPKKLFLEKSIPQIPNFLWGGEEHSGLIQWTNPKFKIIFLSDQTHPHNVSHVMFHVSHVIFHVSHVMCYMKKKCHKRRWNDYFLLLNFFEKQVEEKQINSILPKLTPTLVFFDTTKMQALAV